MSKKLYFLICFVSVVTLTSAGYTSELIGNFEQDLDGWVPDRPPVTEEMLTRSTTGATLNDYSLRYDDPGGIYWALRRPLETEPWKAVNNNRVAFSVTWIDAEWIPTGSTYAQIDKLVFAGDVGWQEITQLKDLVSGTASFSPGSGNVTERLVWDYSGVDFSSLSPDPYDFYLSMTAQSDNGGPFYFDNFVFFDSAFANEPIPANTQTQVDLDANLAWTPGDYAIAHDIYFGTNFTDVNNADNSGTPGPTEIYRANQTNGNEEYIIPETLDIGTTYYWRVDENNSVELLKGEVWSFTTKVAEARLPYPADGAINVPHTLVLSWIPGVLADLHDVYFGTDLTEVNEATVPLEENLDVDYYDVSTIVNWDKTYFWRIDEVNGLTTWKGPVWSFRLIGAIAANPSPASPSADVSPFVTLTWTPGGEADSHQVYISADFSQVDLRDANVMTPEISNTHEPGPLDFDTTYYWAVDEVNLAADVNTWFGDIWQFTTTTNLVVDDFDSYDDGNPLVYDSSTETGTWIDGWENDSGAIISLETIIVNDDDGNSMMFDYDNTYKLSGNMYGSWADAAIADLQIGTDWTLAGTKSLILYFYGDPTNAATVNDKMYVALDDGTTVHSVYYPDVNEINEPSWHEWPIDLEDFNSNGVVLENISKIAIGLGTYGGSPTSGSYGIVYFDNIELWPPLCRTELVAADFDGDCDVDGYDLEIMSNEWLETDVNLTLAISTPNEPVLWYSFEEADGTVAADQMGAYDGTVMNLGDDTWDTTGGRDGGGCINLAADSGTYVSIPTASLNFAGTTNKITFAAWVNGDRFNSQEAWGSLFCVRATGGDPPEDGDEVVEVHCPTPIPPDFGDGPLVEWRVAGSDFCASETLNNMDFAGRWNHYAFTKDADADTMSIYHNGQLVAEVVDVNSALDPMFDTPVQLFYIGARHIYWGYYIGRIDDFRVYDYDLSPEEVAYLATDGTGSLFIPLDTPANVYDVAPNMVNFRDFSVFAENWLKEQLWPLP